MHLPYVVIESTGPVATFASPADAMAFVSVVGPEVPGVIGPDGGIVGGRPARHFTVTMVCVCGQTIIEGNPVVVWRRKDGEEVYCGWTCPKLPVPKARAEPAQARGGIIEVDQDDFLKMMAAFGIKSATDQIE